jgi:hypothetical protein
MPMSLENVFLFLEEFSRSPVIQLVIAFSTIWAVLVAARSAKLAARANREAAKIGEESVRIGKENTAHNAAMLAQSDRHNRLSVRPVLIKFNSFEIEDGGVSFVTGIRNSGMGPAVIRSIKFFHKGAEVTAPIWSDAPLEVAKLCLADINLRWWSRRHGSLGKGSALIVGKESVLLEVFFPFEQKQGDRTSKKTADYIKKIVDDASTESGYEVVFTSVYGDEQFDPLKA